MKKQAYYLHELEEDPFLVKRPDLIIWHTYVAGRYIASHDLIALIEQNYFFN